jgi:hypothetical protein
MMSPQKVFKYLTYVPNSALYRFDSYRLTWRCRVARGVDWAMWAGFTGKISDAEVTLVGAT